jgi:hypothetical protein
MGSLFYKDYTISTGAIRDESTAFAANVITLNRVRIVRVLSAIAAFFVLANVAVQITRSLTLHENMYGLLPLFDLDKENNLPSHFSAFLLLLAAVLLWVITIFKRRSGAQFASKWTILACTFLYLAVDEVASLHELLMRPTKEFLGRELISGILYAAWVVPGFLVTVPLAFSFLRFLLHLPKQIGSLFLLAGGLYVGGALGVEMFGMRYFEVHDVDLTYSMFVMLEESLEMAGVIVFIHALLLYIEANYPDACVRLDRGYYRQHSRQSS